MSAERIFQSIAGDDPETLARLLDRDPALASARNEQGISAILFALYHRKEERARQLAEAAPALDLFEACALGEDLSEHLATPEALSVRSPDGFTPLHLAAFFGREEAAAQLLGAGAEPDAVAENPSRVRPLHSAVAARNEPICRLLLDAGVDVNARQHGGWTALHSAALHEEEGLARLFLSRGADPGQAADDGQTAVDLVPAGNSALRALLEGEVP